MQNQFSTKKILVFGVNLNKITLDIVCLPLFKKMYIGNSKETFMHVWNSNFYYIWNLLDLSFNDFLILWKFKKNITINTQNLHPMFILHSIQFSKYFELFTDILNLVCFFINVNKIVFVGSRSFNTGFLSVLQYQQK